MANYCITAAKPKGASHHLNSEFYLWKLNTETDKWQKEGWKTISQVVTLMQVGNSVVTAEEKEKSISVGAAVEVELRIAHNKTKYPISKMPDKPL